MNKRTLTILGLAMVMGAALPAAAQHAGEFALGFNNDDAPIGLRYFVGETMAIDAGFGFDSSDLGPDNANSYFFEFGLWHVVYDYGPTYFFLRPAVAYSVLDDRIFGEDLTEEDWKVLDLELNLGAEVRFADHFGVTFQHGFRYTRTSLPDEIVPEGGEDSFTDFHTLGENVTEAGVWFTF